MQGVFGCARTFAYLRVSIAGQATETRKQQIEAAGIEIKNYRGMAETISGRGAAMERSGFARLNDRREPRDMLHALAHLVRPTPRQRKASVSKRKALSRAISLTGSKISNKRRPGQAALNQERPSEHAGNDRN